MQLGEIDIIEGVHDNEHNQVAWHTGAGAFCEYHHNEPGLTLALKGCSLTPQPQANFSGKIVVHTRSPDRGAFFTTDNVCSNTTVTTIWIVMDVSMTIPGVALLSGVERLTGPTSIHKGEVFSS